MLLGIPDKDKIRLGAFLSFQLKKWLRNHPDQSSDLFICGICSKPEFQSILEGKPLSDSSIYEYLLQKLGFAYNYDDRLASNYIANAKEMLEDLEFDQMASFYKRLNHYLKELESMDEYALESITHKSLLCMQEVDCSSRSFAALLLYYPILDCYMKEICGHFLLTYIHQHTEDEIDRNWMEEHGLLSLKALRNRYRILNLFITWEDYYDAANYCEDLLKACRQENNVRVAFQTQISRLFIVLKIQPNAFESYANVVLENPILQEESNDPHVYEFYHVVGLYYFIEKNYEQAWLYFLRSVADETYFFPEIIFLNYISTLLNKPLPDELVEQRDIECEDRMYKSIYTYYCLKNKGETLQTLENYLWDHCKDEIYRFSPSWVMKDIIRTELEWISNQTGDTRKMNRFMNLED